MTPEHTHLIYFSPTGTTRRILEPMARAMGCECPVVVDITSSQVRNAPAPEFTNDLVILGAPVYAGRLPAQAVDYFKTLKARNTPVVLVVLYGNREFEDALLEMKTLAVESGFSPLAAAAFIGEHSFSSEDLPIAPGRPDDADLERARELGRQVKSILDGIPSADELSDLPLPGNIPFKEGMAPIPFSAIQVSEDCTGCGVCMEVCPVDAVDAGENYVPVANQCIMCCACIKACPEQARAIAQGPFTDKAQWLADNCAQRKEPEIFLP